MNDFIMINEQAEQIEQTIVTCEQAPIKKKWCIVGIVGFCVSVLAALIVLSAVLMLVIDANLGTVIIFIFEMYLGGVVGVVGLVLSAVGLAVTLKRKLRGLTFSVIGLALCVVMAIVLLYFICKS